jgi:hypothetical protein
MCPGNLNTSGEYQFEVYAGWTRYISENGLRSFGAFPQMTEARDGIFWMNVDYKQVLRFRYREPPVPKTHIKRGIGEPLAVSKA